MFVCIYLWIKVHTYVPVCLWKPEVDVEYIYLLVSILFIYLFDFQTRSLTEMEACQLATKFQRSSCLCFFSFSLICLHLHA